MRILQVDAALISPSVESDGFSTYVKGLKLCCSFLCLYYYYDGEYVWVFLHHAESLPVFPCKHSSRIASRHPGVSPPHPIGSHRVSVPPPHLRAPPLTLPPQFLLLFPPNEALCPHRNILLLLLLLFNPKTHLQTINCGEKKRLHRAWVCFSLSQKIQFCVK